MKWFLVGLCVLVVVPLSMAVPSGEDAKEEIIGRWDHHKTDSCYIRFFPDGVFRMVTLNEKMEGRFRFLPGGVIEFRLPVGKRPGTSEIKYRLEGSTLELKFGKEWTKYKRVD